MFDILCHADWSTEDSKKWITVGERTPRGWQVAAPRRVDATCEFVDRLLFSGRTVLAGFDFPIGLPVALGNGTGFAGFPDALMKFGSGDWVHFFAVADTPEDISSKRPFYPNTPRKGCRQADLLGALGVENIDALRRECERETREPRAACSIFWTLGGNQVGKAAIDGWQSVIRPVVLRGARLWPFNCQLAELSKLARCVLCETYPREAYSPVGVRLGGSKRTQEHRQRASAPVLVWAKKWDVSFARDARKALVNGFGLTKSGEDPFDSFIGLLGMIEVVDGRRNEGNASSTDVMRWEGWIFGQAARESFA